LHASHFKQNQCRMIFFYKVQLQVTYMQSQFCSLYVKFIFYTCKIVSSVSLGYLHNEFTADGVTNENNPETESKKSIKNGQKGKI